MPRRARATDPAGFERLKAGLAFALLEGDGDVDARDGAGGIYCRDTRVVDRYRVRAGTRRLERLGSENLDDRLVVRLCLRTAAGDWQFERTVRLTEDALVDRWRWRAPATARPLRLVIETSTAFLDIFEVRGMHRPRRGALQRDADGLGVRYRGLDRRLYRLRLSGRRLEAGPAGASIALPPARGGRRRGTFTLGLRWRTGAVAFVRGVRPADVSFCLPELHSNDPLWDRVWRRAARDLRMLAADLGHGPILLAGLPWFGSLFGRDALISALLLLPLAPGLARSTVDTLAALQGTRRDPWREESPGKILHERRLGEMARTGEVPFGRYYGAVDSTALWVTLLVRTWRMTRDDAWLRSHEAALRAALGWIAESGRADRALGLYRFAPSAPGGLIVQSWKDSADSMVHADGSVAPPPLAVAEVQGYVYQALRGAALALTVLGDAAMGESLRQEAQALKRRFHGAFWQGAGRGYAMAVDGLDRPLAVVSSDPGQCLWSGIVPERWRHATARRLMAADVFSGWGLRTLSASERAYDPVSYHRGSVWPHDTALAAIGMYEAGERRASGRLARALVEAAGLLGEARLPELFSGASRRHGLPPELYAAACLPQAWAAAAPLGLVVAALSLRIDERRRAVRFTLPADAGLTDFALGPIRVADGELALEVAGGAGRLSLAPKGWHVGRSQRRA